MDKIDKILTHWIWLVIILAIFIGYFFGALTGLLTVISVLTVWGIIELSNPKNVIGIVHYKSGTTEKFGIFERYSTYEDWKNQMLKENGNIINYIDYELYIEEKE